MTKIVKMLNLSLAFSILLITGCSIFPRNPEIPVTYFDIGLPAESENLKKAPQVDVLNVQSMDTYTDRMVFRVSETHIKIDEYNRWASLPNEMLKKYFVLAFNQSENNKFQIQGNDRLELYVKILCLESDLSRKTVRVILSIQVRNALKGEIVYSEILSEEQSVDNVTAENFSEVAKKVIDKMLDKLCVSLISIEKAK